MEPRGDVDTVGLQFVATIRQLVEQCKHHHIVTQFRQIFEGFHHKWDQVVKRLHNTTMRWESRRGMGMEMVMVMVLAMVMAMVMVVMVMVMVIRNIPEFV